jgi:hypothetical protein
MEDKEGAMVEITKQPETKVCAKCHEPWKTDQKQCDCGSDQSKWGVIDPETKKLISDSKPVIRL